MEQIALFEERDMLVFKTILQLYEYICSNEVKPFYLISGDTKKTSKIYITYIGKDNQRKSKYIDISLENEELLLQLIDIQKKYKMYISPYEEIQEQNFIKTMKIKDFDIVNLYKR